jgi:hypothetical protein
MRYNFPKVDLKGVGCNWENDSLDYIIGDFIEITGLNMCDINIIYPMARYAEIELPDDGWRIYHTTLDKLQSLYEEIYKDGALKYEVEEISQNGNCKISIFRD